MFWELKNRAVLKLTGNDVERFLQGLLTNDIKKSQADNLIYTMLLTPQGRFLYDFFILRIEDGFLLDCPAPRMQEIISKLQMYKLRQDVLISDVSDKLIVMASDEKTDGFLPDPRNDKMGYRKITMEKFADLADISSYEKLRISNLIPDAELDFIYNRSLPLEYGANELNAIDYMKGCYVGQEVTARTNYRGVVRKKLYKFSSEALLGKEAGVSVNGEELGIVLGMSEKVGLCLLNKELYEKYSTEVFHVGENKILVEHD